MKIPSTRIKTERPREPLLQLDIGVGVFCSDRWETVNQRLFWLLGSQPEIPPLTYRASNTIP